MKENLNSLFAAGGGDGPEATTAALKAATDLDWRSSAAKMAILITDAPPHGIGEYGDGFPNGSPDGEDPLVLARKMSAMGIPLFVVACEPALSGYQHAVDFYQGIVNVTGGMLVPLTTASLLSQVVIAAAGEVMDMERLHREVGDSVLELMRNLSLTMGNEASNDPASATERLVDQVSAELHEKLLLRNESTKQLIIESIYRESEGKLQRSLTLESAHNIRVWSQAPDVFSARPHIRKVIGSRLSQKFIEMRRQAAQHGGHVPLRFGSLSPKSTRSGAPSSSSSTRQIVSQFHAFEARPGMSLHGSSGATTDYARFGSDGYRTSSADDMDDDGDDAVMADSHVDMGTQGLSEHDILFEGDDGQRLAFRHDAISLSQARRLAMQTLSRAS